MKNKAANVFDAICELLPKTNGHRIWSNGEEILCETMELAEHIADLVDAFYGDKVALTGYYDGEYIPSTGSKSGGKLVANDDKTGKITIGDSTYGMKWEDDEYKEENVELIAWKTVKGKYPDTEHVKFKKLFKKS